MTLSMGPETPAERAVLAGAGPPAFVRRARAVEAAIEELRGQLQGERSRKLRWLFSAARPVDAALREGAPLPSWAASVVEALRAEPRFSARAARPARSLPRALRELGRRVAAFNAAWGRHLSAVSLARVHQAQNDYNRYFVIEREAALRSAPPQPFRPVVLLERSSLAHELPPLAAPPCLGGAID